MPYSKTMAFLFVKATASGVLACLVPKGREGLTVQNRTERSECSTYHQVSGFQSDLESCPATWLRHVTYSCH